MSHDAMSDQGFRELMRTAAETLMRQRVVVSDQ